MRSSLPALLTSTRNGAGPACKARRWRPACARDIAQIGRLRNAAALPVDFSTASALSSATAALSSIKPTLQPCAAEMLHQRGADARAAAGDQHALALKAGIDAPPPHRPWDQFGMDGHAASSATGRAEAMALAVGGKHMDHLGIEGDADLFVAPDRAFARKAHHQHLFAAVRAPHRHRCRCPDARSW